jgi:hypothetical protein
VESNWVHSALRPLIGLLCPPRVIMMMQKLVEWLAGETEELGENLPSAALSTTNPICCPYANPGRRSGRPATNRLSYGTAYRSRYCMMFYMNVRHWTHSVHLTCFLCSTALNREAWPQILVDTTTEMRSGPCGEGKNLCFCRELNFGHYSHWLSRHHKNRNLR